MIVSAVSLWKKFNVTDPLDATEWGEEQRDNKTFSHVSFFGRTSFDGRVRIYARFCRPDGNAKKPVVLFLPDAGARPDDELLTYFADKGYAVMIPDYSGKTGLGTNAERLEERIEDIASEGEQRSETKRTVYPQSLSHGNYVHARGLKTMQGLSAEETTMFEWTYVALYCIEYLKNREDVGEIGIVGVRQGGDIAWQAMLSADIKCGVPINAVGWYSFLEDTKFGEVQSRSLDDDQHRYIAAVEAQSYAPYVKCPVLMLCGLREREIDCDRAYDTYSRIGNEENNALLYSLDSGACIGPNALMDMDLFLERYLKGREIYIPVAPNVTLTETEEGLEVYVESDREGILEEIGIVYAEADAAMKSVYRDWHCIYKTDGKSVKDGKLRYIVKPFEGADMAFAYAYTKYINGFRIVSKITGKKLSGCNPSAVKSRMLFSGKETDTFGVAEYENYAIGGIFMEREAMPKMVVGYGDIKGAYSLGGLCTYKVSAPKYAPDENAMLEFDVYGTQDGEMKVTVDFSDLGRTSERYSCNVRVKGGGKWNRVILKAADLKGESCGMPLTNFCNGKALSFTYDDEEKTYAVTNILWL